MKGTRVKRRHRTPQDQAAEKNRKAKRELKALKRTIRQLQHSRSRRRSQRSSSRAKAHITQLQLFDE
jgi:hypothetical protein